MVPKQNILTPDEPTYVMLNLTIQNKHHENTCYLPVVLQLQNFRTIA